MKKLRDRLRAGLNKARAWLTDARRQAVHAALGTIATLGVTVGWLNDGQATALLGLTGATLALAQGALGLTLLRASDAGRWFGTVGRGLVYGLAAACGAVGVAFHLWGDDSVTGALGVVSVGLTIVSSFLSVVNVHTVAPVQSPDTRDLSTVE
jgi:hypothetical protein